MIRSPSIFVSISNMYSYFIYHIELRAFSHFPLGPLGIFIFAAPTCFSYLLRLMATSNHMKSCQLLAMLGTASDMFEDFIEATFFV